MHAPPESFLPWYFSLNSTAASCDAQMMIKWALTYLVNIIFEIQPLNDLLNTARILLTTPIFICNGGGTTGISCAGCRKSVARLNTLYVSNFCHKVPFCSFRSSLQVIGWHLTAQVFNMFPRYSSPCTTSSCCSVSHSHEWIVDHKLTNEIYLSLRAAGNRCTFHYNFVQLLINPSKYFIKFFELFAASWASAIRITSQMSWLGVESGNCSSSFVAPSPVSTDKIKTTRFFCYLLE